MGRNSKILIVGTYPTINPHHGGQKRVAAIYDIYRQRGLIVRYASVVPGKHYLDRTANDVAVSSDTMKAVEANPLLSDVICGEAIYDDPKVRQRFQQIIEQFKPDIIQIEQAYPYIGLKKLLSDMNYSATIINSTHNIESTMKEDIYKAEGINTKLRQEVVAKIRQLERELATDSVVNIAVSQEEASVLKEQFGAKDIVLAPNGMDVIVPSPSHVKKWQDRFDKDSIKHKILFVGSAHTPNMTGFLKMVTKRVGFLPYDAKILVVGGVADLLHRNLDETSVEDVCFTRRVGLLGRLSEADLSALLSLSDVIILPITEGGGSNLKTAEALLAHKKIVATSHAFRGYEEYVRYPNIVITDKPDKFRLAILEQLSAQAESYSGKQEEAINQVLWENALRPLAEKVKNL